MADWPVNGGGSFAKQLNYDAATSGVTSASAFNAGANDTMSSWQEIISSTEKDYCGLNIMIMRKDSNANCNGLVDIGIGASGSQRILIEQIAVSAQNPNCSCFFLPIRVPAGSKLWVRGRTNESGALFYVSLVGVVGDFLFSGYQLCTTYGASISPTGGTSADPTSDHIKSDYEEITPSVEADIKHLIISAMFSPVQTSVHRNFLVDIAAGAPGAEVDIISNLWFWGQSSEIVLPHIYSLPIKIPAGTRLSMRVQQNNVDTNYTIELVLHGLS